MFTMGPLVRTQKGLDKALEYERINSDALDEADLVSLMTLYEQERFIESRKMRQDSDKGKPK